MSKSLVFPSSLKIPSVSELQPVPAESPMARAPGRPSCEWGDGLPRPPTYATTGDVDVELSNTGVDGPWNVETSW